ncbi:NADPH:quinone oxidoreductase family protein [Nocardia sp. BMG111209]|uniref:NADPH:quinone oxidoreductase family protein n=1 Tax=Nocardia sp. BMG111209 TaxID=1160137 RepID=UPI0003621021|nr:NADPH:quinone oxidoreductase family protein [Nocardia sp. BMG111209]
MRAAQVTELEGPESIEIVDIPEPASTPDGVVIDVHAAGVAFPDVLMSRGLYQIKPELPFVVGGEVAGIVRAAPAGAHVRPGDRVVALTMVGNALAEVAVTPVAQVFALPDAVPLEAGAGLLFNDLTVHCALRTRGRLAEGETVLVHGAAGGIGTSALRMAPAFGAGRVIAVVSSAEKAAVARAHGATDVVLTDGWAAAVKELTGGRGVDVVVDPVGGDRFTDSLRSLAPAGRLLVLGFTGGEIPTVRVNRLLLNNIDVIGVGWGAWVLSHPGYLAEQWAEVEPLLASGRIAPPQPVLFPLERAAEAVAALENRSALGKVVVTLR